MLEIMNVVLWKQGDSGGPLVVEQDGVMVLTGVVSGGIGNGKSRRRRSSSFLSSHLKNSNRFHSSSVMHVVYQSPSTNVVHDWASL